MGYLVREVDGKKDISGETGEREGSLPEI